MILFLLRLLWRLIIFALGAISLGFLINTFWPEPGNRIAAFFSFLIVYCLMAYVVIPGLVRLFHVFSKSNHIPLYVSTGDGWPSDPVNLALIVHSRNDLERAMKKAGWYTADPLTFRNGLREFIAMVLNRPYPEAPLSSLYLFDRPEDISFEMPVNANGSPRTRHHVRFWRLEKPTKKSRNNSHYEFWIEKISEALSLKREVWIGAATEDHRLIGVEWRTGQITHGVSHDADRERDFILETLQNANLVAKISSSQPGEEMRFHGQLFHFGRKHFRMSYVTDGSIKIARIK